MIPIRVRRVWNGLIVAIGAAIGLVAALMLTLEAYWRALKPSTVFSCDVNTKLSCSAVAESWQSQLIKLPSGPVPNALLGVVAFTVVLVLGVVYACGSVMPRWFDWCFRIGVVCELVFASWLLYQSMFVIGVMCPWCLSMDAGSILMTIGMIRLALTEDTIRFDRDGINHVTSGFRFAGGMESLFAEVVIIIVFAIFVVFHYAGFY